MAFCGVVEMPKSERRAAWEGGESWIGGAEEKVCIGGVVDGCVVGGWIGWSV